MLCDLIVIYVVTFNISNDKVLQFVECSYTSRISLP